MLRPSEFDAIQVVLTRILAMNQSRQYFTALFDASFFVELSEIAGPAATDEQVAAAALRVCVRREWLEDPCWLVRLLMQIGGHAGLAGVGVVPNLNDIVQRLNDRINVLNEIWHSSWVRNGFPFADRAALRETLEDLSSAGGRAILRIEGDPRSGKTYTTELLEYVSEASAWKFKIIQVKIEEGGDQGMNALTLAQIIVGEMGFANTPRDSPLLDPTVHNISSLLSWILRCAINSGRQWWLFFDGFRFLPQQNSARSLAQGLADKIANGSHRQYLRLILTDFDTLLSRVDDEKIAYDRLVTPLPDPEARAAVRDCLDRVYKDAKRNPAPGDLDARTEAVLAGIPPNEAWTPALSKRLRAMARGIRNGQ